MGLTIRDLHIEYPGTLVFDALNLDVNEGETIAIETQVLDGGTSLLRGIGGFLSGVGGDVQLNGINLLTCDASERAALVGFVYEQQGLVSFYTTYENIVLPLQFHSGLSQDEIHERVHRECAALNVEEALFNLKPHQLNDVQIRLINLARALCVNPQLLLIDELEGGMSEEYLQATMARLQEKQQNSPMAIIITTSNEFVMQKADKVYSIANNDLVLEH